MILLFAYFSQVLLGRFIHNRRLKLAKLGPIIQPHPPLNILHISLGVTIIALAFFQVNQIDTIIETPANITIISGPQWFGVVGGSNRSRPNHNLGTSSLERLDHRTFRSDA